MFDKKPFRAYNFLDFRIPKLVEIFMNSQKNTVEDLSEVVSLKNEIKKNRFKKKKIFDYSFFWNSTDEIF